MSVNGAPLQDERQAHIHRAALILAKLDGKRPDPRYLYEAACFLNVMDALGIV